MGQPRLLGKCEPRQVCKHETNHRGSLAAPLRQFQFFHQGAKEKFDHLLCEQLILGFLISLRLFVLHARHRLCRMLCR